MAGEFSAPDGGASTGKLLSSSHTGRRNHTLLSWRKYRCLVPARQRDGATARGGETTYERSHGSSWQKTNRTLGRYGRSNAARTQYGAINRSYGGTLSVAFGGRETSFCKAPKQGR